MLRWRDGTVKLWESTLPGESCTMRAMARHDLPVRDQRRRNRALLARHPLPELATPSIPDALSQVDGLQTRYAPSGYVGPWTRLAGLGAFHR